jgi:hypothetical protein
LGGRGAGDVAAFGVEGELVNLADELRGDRIDFSEDDGLDPVGPIAVTLRVCRF